ncbi:ATP-binding protein [Terasakiella pusilla]|uniref:ATP-binding protein n=1 Tax=Terasakiella pusilla TaxID=64973 RepID=UPI003AA7C87D
MGLRLKLLLPLLSCAVLMMVVTHLFFLPHMIAQEVADKRKTEQEHLNILGVSVKADLLSSDIAKVYLTLREAEGRPGWLGLLLTNETGKILYPISPTDLTIANQISHEIRYNGAVIATLGVGLDEDRIVEAVKAKYLSIEMAFLALIGTSILVTALLMHHFAIRPLDMLVNASEEIAKGQRDVTFPKAGRDEIGRLVDAYKTMVLELQNREESLKKEKQIKEDLLVQAQNSLHASEAAMMKNKAQWNMVSQIVNSSPIATYVMDKNHVVTHWNTAAERLTGASVMKMIGQTSVWKAFYKSERPVLADLIIDKAYDQIEHYYGASRLKGSADRNVWEAESHFDSLPSGPKTMKFYAAAIQNGDGEVIGAIQSIQDVTEERELQSKLEERVDERTHKLNMANKKLEDTIDLLKLTQDELIEAEKMSSLASLVGGVAHEVNTPLGVCITASTHQAECRQHLSQKITEQKLKKSDLDVFLDQCSKTEEILDLNLKRAAGLIRSFKQVAVDQNSEEEREIDLQTYIGEILTSLHPNIKKTQVEVVSNIPANIHFKTYPGSLAQIITNLVMNSLIHAFPDQTGQITIEADFDGAVVYLLFSDNGVGMSGQTVRKIFEPFYTTKRNSGGSGLGMHIVYNLVTHKLKGSIKCISQPQKGSQFVISFKADVG